MTLGGLPGDGTTWREGVREAGKRTGSFDVSLKILGFERKNNGSVAAQREKQERKGVCDHQLDILESSQCLLIRF